MSGKRQTGDKMRDPITQRKCREGSPSSVMSTWCLLHAMVGAGGREELVSTVTLSL